MASVTYQNVYKRFGDVEVITDVSVEIEDKEFVVFVGPSGSGKSTLLRLLAGLEEITEGQIMIGDRVVNDVPPKDRDIAMVFQSYALYPHMSVYDNMAFGLKLRKTPKDEIDRRVKDAAETLGLAHLLDRKPKALSGGQRQRVAVGRAIVREPAVFLMDEPLSNLDAKLRVSARAEISKLHQRLGTTFVYVTHDQVEAMTMGDRVAVMNEGVLQQVDSPLALYDTPRNLFVAGFIGSPAMNLLDGRVTEGGVLIGDFVVPVAREVLHRAGGEQVLTIGIRPENFQLDETGIGMDIAVVEELGADSYLYGTLTGDSTLDAPQLIARITSRRTPQRGARVRLAADPDYVHVFSPTTGDRIS